MNTILLGQQIALKHAAAPLPRGNHSHLAYRSCDPLGCPGLSEATKAAAALQAHVTRLERELQAREHERQLMMMQARQSDQRAEQAAQALHAGRADRAQAAEEELAGREVWAQAREARAVQIATLGDRAQLEEAHRLRRSEQAASAALREALGRAEAAARAAMSREAVLQAALREAREEVHGRHAADASGGADESTTALLRRQLRMQEEQVLSY